MMEKAFWDPRQVNFRDLVANSRKKCEPLSECKVKEYSILEDKSGERIVRVRDAISGEHEGDSSLS